MSDMKYSGIEWIGNVPEKWKYNKLKNLIIPLPKSNIQASDGLVEGRYPFYTSSQILNKKINVALYNGNAITMSTGGSASVNYSSCNFSTSTDCFNFQSSNYTKYLYYHLYSEKNIINDLWFEGMGLRHLQKYPLLNSIVLIPNDMEQKLIADFLDEKVSIIDSIINDLNKQVLIINNYKQQLITETITKGLNKKTKYVDSNIDWIGKIPNTWKIKKIKYCSKLTRGIFGHRPRNDSDYYDGEYPFIQTGDIANSNIYIDSYSQTLSELGRKVSKEFKKGTIAMSIAANVGDVSILSFDSYFPDSVLAIEPNKGYSKKYLFYILFAMKEQFLKVAMISTQLNLNIERVGSVKIPITDNLEEQKEIVHYLDEKYEEIDKILNNKKKQIEQMEQYKESVIYEYVTGKKRVEGAEELYG